MTNGITSSIEFDVDVLVIGGGPAGAWAACSAAANKARVVLVDKGYCGSSGATAAAGTGVWYIPPEQAAREKAMASRDSLGGFLADRAWMRRVLDRTVPARRVHRDHLVRPIDEAWPLLRRNAQKLGNDRDRESDPNGLLDPTDHGHSSTRLPRTVVALGKQGIAGRLVAPNRCCAISTVPIRLLAGSFNLRRSHAMALGEMDRRDCSKGFGGQACRGPCDTDWRD